MDGMWKTIDFPKDRLHTPVMNILCIEASQRVNSNSKRMLQYVTDALLSGETHSIEFYSLRELHIACLGCEECLMGAKPHGDDLDPIYESLLTSDLLIMATPTCCGMTSAFGKVFMDRSDQFWFDQKLKGKRGAIIVNGASEDERIAECVQSTTWFYEAHGMTPLHRSVAITNSEQYPDSRFPDPLPDNIQQELNELIAEIQSIA